MRRVPRAASAPANSAAPRLSASDSSATRGQVIPASAAGRRLAPRPPTRSPARLRSGALPSPRIAADPAQRLEVTRLGACDDLGRKRCGGRLVIAAAEAEQVAHDLLAARQESPG